MAEAGMSPYQILRSATQNIGEYLSHLDHFGTVTPGNRADLILLEGNLLENISQVAHRSGVMLRGQWIPEPEIQERLANIAASLRD